MFYFEDPVLQTQQICPSFNYDPYKDPSIQYKDWIVVKR